jgi:chromate transporter
MGICAIDNGDQAVSDPRPTLWQLLRVFGRVGLTAFGGGVTLHLQQQLTRRGWVTSGEYVDVLNWCQALPGPNATNLSAFIGWRFWGLAGAAGSTLALVAPGALVVLLLTQSMAGIGSTGLVAAALEAVAAGVVGLFLASVWSLSGAVLVSRGAWAIAAATFVLVGLAHCPAPVVIGAMLVLQGVFTGAGEDTRRVSRRV